jgi:hypothetical protein
MLIVFPLFVCLVGLLMYALCVNPKLADIGRIMFAVGLFVVVFASDKVVGLIR